MLNNVQVPLKRVNQVYVIATTTKVPVDKIDLSKFEDSYFKATEKKSTKKGESEFFESEPEKKVSNRLTIFCSILTYYIPSLVDTLSPFIGGTAMHWHLKPLQCGLQSVIELR